MKLFLIELNKAVEKAMGKLVTQTGQAMARALPGDTQLALQEMPCTQRQPPQER